MSVLAKTVVFSYIICADYKDNDYKNAENPEGDRNKYPPAESSFLGFDFRFGRNNGRFLYNMIFRRKSEVSGKHISACFSEGNVKSNVAYFGKLA